MNLIKKTAIAGAAVMMCLGTISYASEISGTYEGWYYAVQGQTGLTLTIKDDSTGVFDFYNMPGMSNAKDGKYTVSIENNEDGSYTVKGKEWIEEPSGYSFVTLKGSLEDNVFYGSVDDKWEFRLIKNNENYQEVFDSVYNNHKYQLFLEGLTWEQAEAECRSLGGHLVSINSEGEQHFIEQLMENADL